MASYGNPHRQPHSSKTSVRSTWNSIFGSVLDFELRDDLIHGVASLRIAGPTLVWRSALKSRAETAPGPRSSHALVPSQVSSRAKTIKRIAHAIEFFFGSGISGKKRLSIG